MKPRTLLLVVAIWIAAVTTCFASDLNVGTWKLNESKSKIPAGANKNTTVVYTAEADQYKCAIDGVDGSGKSYHNDWTGKFDGKDYPVTGDSNADTRAIKRVDDHHYDVNNKKGGKIVLTGNIVLSPDGKTRTLTTHGTDASGKKTSATYVYERQ